MHTITRGRALAGLVLTLAISFGSFAFHASRAEGAVSTSAI